MLINEVNTVLRLMFNELIESGFKKFPMAEVTLGKSFSPQFNKFLEDVDLGLNPLTRMVNGLGFDLHLVPVKSDNSEFKKLMEDQFTSFLATSKNDLIDHIENRPEVKKGKTNKLYEDIVDDLLNGLD